MNNDLTNIQTETNVYTYLTQVQSFYSQYLQIQLELKQFDSNLKLACDTFEKIPNLQNLGLVQTVWNQKFNLMQQVPSIADNIVLNLVNATRLALTSMQVNIASNNKVNVALSDNTIASICTYVGQTSNNLNLQPYYKQQCINNGVSMQVSEIEVRARITGIYIPNFERLKIIIRGY